MNDFCEIIVKGQLDADWSGWLGGLTITHNDKGETILSGPIRDQAALYGIFAKMRNMALFIISVKYMVAESSRANADSEDNS